MTKATIKQMIVDLIKIRTKTREEDKYEKEFVERFESYSLRSAEKSQEATLKLLSQIGNTKVSEQHQTLLNNAIQSIYDAELLPVDLRFVYETVSDLYVSKVPKEKYRKKQFQVDTDLDLTNRQTGDIIGNGQVVWIKDYSTDNETSKMISNLLSIGIENKMTGSEIAGLLKLALGEETPETFKARFGETRYWKGVADQHISKVRTISDVHNYQEAGIGKLRIYARMNERTCEICGKKHRTVIQVKDAVSVVESYLSSAKSGSIEGMKKAMPWGDTGKLPTFHMDCKCYSEPVFEDDYIIENELDLIGNMSKSVAEKLDLFAKALNKHNRNLHESAVIVGTDGRVLGFSDGSRSTVVFHKPHHKALDDSQSVVHNHPGNSSLSCQDALLSLKYGNTVYASTEKYLYSIKVSNISKDLLKTEFFDRYKDEKQYNQDAHKIWTEIAKKYPGVKYERKPNE